jgi:hypothetical protein
VIRVLYPIYDVEKGGRYQLSIRIEGRAVDSETLRRGEKCGVRGEPDNKTFPELTELNPVSCFGFDVTDPPSVLQNLCFYSVHYYNQLPHINQYVTSNISTSRIPN